MCKDGLQSELHLLARRRAADNAIENECKPESASSVRSADNNAVVESSECKPESALVVHIEDGDDDQDVASKTVARRASR